MYIVPIAWIYVALMMSVVEATSSNGSVMGAIITFVLYGLMPVGLVVYIMGTPGRKRQLKARQEEERAAYLATQQATQQVTQQATQQVPQSGTQGAHPTTTDSSTTTPPPAPNTAATPADTAQAASVNLPDAGGHAATDPITPVRKEP